MKNLEALKDDLNFKLQSYSILKVDKIIDNVQNNLYTLVMSSPWVDRETLNLISELTGDTNPTVYKHQGEKYDCRLEIMVEWLDDKEIPF